MILTIKFQKLSLSTNTIENTNNQISYQALISFKMSSKTFNNC